MTHGGLWRCKMQFALLAASEKGNRVLEHDEVDPHSSHQPSNLSRSHLLAATRLEKSMSQQLFWIHKSADSERLSQCSRSEESKIRRHVQSAKSGPIIATKADAQNAQSTAKAFKRALRPNPSLRQTGKGNNAKASRDVDERSGDVWSIGRPLRSGWQSLDSYSLRSLAFFEARTSVECSGWEDMSFWGRLVLQVSQHSQAIAYGFISSPAASYAYAVLHKHASARNAQLAAQALMRSEPPLFEALVSCVIMLVLQGVQHGRHAFRLLRAGNQLLQEYDAKQALSTGHVASPAEAHAIETKLRPLMRRLTARAFRLGDISTAFSMSVAREWDALTDESCRKTQPVFPSSFQSLVEARDCLLEMLQWAHHCLACPSTACSLTGFRDLHSHWMNAVGQLVPRTTEDASTTSKPSRLLQVSALFAKILVETYPVQQETDYDQHIQDFAQIVTLLEPNLPTGPCNPPEISFGVDDGVADILGFVGHKCRDPHIRRRAVSLLMHSSRVEGDRNSTNTGEILKVHIALEERNNESITACHDVAEADRWRLICGQQFFAQGLIRLFFARSPYDPALGADVTEHYIRLPGPMEGDPSSEQPDAVFAPGFAAFLDDPLAGTYYRGITTNFHCVT
ncbi:uncharacterized protein MYCFIDRAFT_176552 [Pseudocercospora fijiensis CIRAD86]|uniref:Uncharacterized protein n=1 Tax=Pseudocercospora fijiensis (strain CIRAD86) TaxID=383855 RepID=M3A9F5_PSEFD|nr:uncharacterized protein MYCFIDRAFT_176552 [Pseudocercospora fijiensis CIRAD86]EME81251.1 hypothetical protein MYCFIDRAFT_176552 [Pseudocercospora fijiensis CIRAD86]